MRRISMWLGLLTLVLSACATGQQPQPSPTGTQQYTVLVDAVSPEGQNLQVSTYFPAVVQAHPGDELTFQNQSSQTPHTITFGVAADGSDWPTPVTADGKFNPVVFGPCFTDQTPTATLSSCPQQPGEQPPAFDGRGLWSSYLQLDLPDIPDQAKSVQVKLADTIAPGRYPYVCLLHPFMGGVVDVVDRAAPVWPPAQVTQAAEVAQAEAVAEATRLKEPEAVAASGGAAVNAGWGDNITAVNRFEPAKVTVPAGTAVTWKSHSPYEPHVITFGQPPFASPDDPAVLIPAGVPPGERYAGGFAHSGFIGPAPFPTDTYSLTFTKPGTYEYVCLIHPEMAGTVEVT